MVPKTPLVMFVIAALLAATSPNAVAGTPQNPEIQDASGDVDPLALAGIKPDEAKALDTNATTYDIIAAYITGENRQGFLMALQVRDLEGASTPTDPTGSTPPTATPSTATYLMHFTTGESAYAARAEVDVRIVEGDTPTPVAFTNFTLHKDDAAAGSETLIATLTGALHVQADTVLFWIPKELIGAPQDGQQLNRFWATSGHQGVVLDQAPDLNPQAADPATIDPTALDPTAPDPAGTAGVRAYGAPYTYGQYPGGDTKTLSLVASGPLDATARPGESVDLAYTLENLGSTAQTVSFTARAPRGWSATFEEASVELAPGSSRILTVTLTPAEDAARSGLVIVRGTSLSNGQSQEISYSVTFDAPASTGTGESTGTGTPTGDTNAGQTPDSAKDSPAVGVLVPILAIAGLLAWNRRRRA